MGRPAVRLLTREQLRTQVWVALTVLKPYEKRALGVVVEQTRKDVTEDLVLRIMGEPESETVILQPDLVGTPYSRVGVWNVDEPHPHPDMVRPR